MYQQIMYTHVILSTSSKKRGTKMEKVLVDDGKHNDYLW